MSRWRDIKSAPRDREILVRVDIAGVMVVRNAQWSDGELWEIQGFDNIHQARGFWAPKHSVTDERLDGIYKPTQWAFMPEED